MTGLFGSSGIPLLCPHMLSRAIHSYPAAMLSLAVNARESRSFLKSLLRVPKMAQALFPNHRRSIAPTMATWAAIARKAAETTAEALEEGVKFSWAENEANKVTAATLEEFGPPLSYDTDSDNDCEPKVKTELNASHNNNNIIMAAEENIVVAPEVPVQNSAGTAPGPAPNEGASSSSAAPSAGASMSRVEEFKLALGDFGTQLGLMVRLKGVAPENVDECVNNIIEKSLDDIIAVKGKEAQKNGKAQGPDAADNKTISAPAQQDGNDPKGKGKAVETTDAFTGIMEGYKLSAAPQLPNSEPHPSRLTVEERRAQVQWAVQSALDLRRLQKLSLTQDTADVIMFFTKPDEVTGETEIPVHRELLIRESTWFSRPGGLPPPNKVDECERNAGSPFHLTHIQCNVNQYVLAVAYGMTRQQQYHLNKVQEHVEWLREHVSHNGPLCNMVLTTGIEIGWCEVPLRHCNTCLWKEVIPEYRAGLRRMHVLIARLNLIIVPWMNRQPCVKPFVDMFWITQQYGRFPWRAWVWHLRSLGTIRESDCDNWSLLGKQMSQAEIARTLKPYHFV
ncbi:uncharacterized protein VDAG_04538 [Verticillium dahliae VdLs.17]|uniref:Uncharacterized protein n=1 Tax=Verticillium dahliae (strain VdLs.17 / ATCC MYA-4575 / FGSC 10137) TaxID=498257 RepID=G2X2L4_VERDV|nr:uncharacterized protein VDAG_04538 [Verticillium dahliae VdLs.17]EGY23100.1 hypothetical protein VDAG_04538 [Verticillium dahliae VdLs.17]